MSGWKPNFQSIGDSSVGSNLLRSRPGHPTSPKAFYGMSKGITRRPCLRNPFEQLPQILRRLLRQNARHRRQRAPGTGPMPFLSLQAVFRNNRLQKLQQPILKRGRFPAPSPRALAALPSMSLIPFAPFTRSNGKRTNVRVSGRRSWRATKQARNLAGFQNKL